MSKDFGESVREHYRKEGEQRAIERITTNVLSVLAMRQIQSQVNGGSYSKTLTFEEAIALIAGESQKRTENGTELPEGENK